MPMLEIQQIVNEAKKEIQEIDVPARKKMQQGKEDFDLTEVRGTDEYQRGGQFPEPSRSPAACWSATSIR